MNLEFPDGSVVIVCPTSETEVREDDFVVVLRRKATLAEATIKQLIKHKKQWALAARSTNPQFKEPWVLKGEQDDEPEIVGVIVAFQKNIQRPPATYNGKRAPRK